MKDLQTYHIHNKTAITEINRSPKIDLSIDIITVTTNDQKWFPAYLQSLINQQNFDLKCINLIVVDNNSKDENFDILIKSKEKAERYLGSFSILKQPKNWGFAGACNIGAKVAKGDLIFFLNIDTELEPNSMFSFYKDFLESRNSFGAWEFRQFPYEHPKIYNPVSGEISWGSGAALMVKRDIFVKIQGFDTSFYMYTDDVDISWRIRLEGHKIKYLPECVVYHFSYQSFNDVKHLQYYHSIFNNLQLRFKFGSYKEIKEGFKLIRGVLKQRGPFEHSRKKLLKLILRNGYKLVKQRKWFLLNRKRINTIHPHTFIGFDYELRREGDFFYNEKPKMTPLISIIIRTVNRPQILKEALITVQNQTYKNLEIIIIEDGKNISEHFITENFPSLQIKYLSTGRKAGRTKAGNLGLSIATGDYLTFLDDDDLLYADHFETLVRQSERNPYYKVFHNLAFEAKTITHSKMPYKYSFLSLETTHKKQFNILRLSLHNFLPIQSVLFHREVYHLLGGFDENLDVLEDWDLWIRYASKFDFYTVFKTCSLYKVPAEKQLADKRQQQLHNAYEEVKRKQLKYSIQTNPIKLSELFKNIDK